MEVLEGLGFPREMCLQALEFANGNLDLAVDLLLSGAMNDPAPVAAPVQQATTQL